jgi:hypothetical protein
LGNVGAGSALKVADGQPEETQPLAPTAEALGRLYRPQALDVPQMVSRDGPIASILPERPAAEAVATAAQPETEEQPVRVLADAAPAVEIMATQPSWVRVRAADGTVLFEKILDAGDSYVVPQSDAPPTLRAGNSGSVYFIVKGQAYGPAAAGAQVVSNVALSPEALSDKYALVDLKSKPEVARLVQVAQAKYLGADDPQE